MKSHAVEYDFILDNGRSNQQLLLINNTDKQIKLKGLKIITDAVIDNTWQALSQAWNANVKKTMTPDGAKNIYELTLPDPLIFNLNPGRTPILEYSVTDAVGPLKGMAVAPDSVAVQVNDQAMQPVMICDINEASDPHPGKELNYYDANWAQYGSHRTLDDQNFKALNRATYAFVGFNESGQVFSLDTWADQLELPKLNLAKKRNPYLKTSLAFGGWTNAGKRMDTVFEDMAANPTARAEFVKNAVAAVVQVGADGIDIDWEYVAKKDADNFVKLICELREELDKRVPHARLTIAAPGGKDNIEALDPGQWKMVASKVDVFSIMTYDYFGSFSQYNDFHSAWRLDPNSPYAHQQGEAPYFCVEKTLELYKQMGIDSNKLVLGIPNYCRGVIVDDLGQFSGLYQPVKGAPMGENGGEGGIYSFDAILKLLRNQPSALDQLGVKSWSYYGPDHPLCQQAQMSLLVGQLPDGKYAVFNFLEPNSAYQRAKYAADHGLRGAMVWANYFEPLRYEDTFLNAISCGLENKPYHFTPKLDRNTHLEAAKHLTSEMKSDLQQRIRAHAKELKTAEVRSSIAFKVLSFIANILPTRFVFAPLKDLAVGMMRKMLNVDVEDKTNTKIAALTKLAEAHTREEAQAIIDENYKELNQHRNPLKRLLVAILPAKLVKDSKWLKTESLRLALKFKASLPSVEGSDKQIYDMSEVHPPVEPDFVIAPPQALYPQVNAQAIQNAFYPAFSQMLPIYSGQPNPYLLPIFSPSAPVEPRTSVNQVSMSDYPQPPAPPSYAEAMRRFQRPDQVVIPQSFFGATSNNGNSKPAFKLHGEGPHHDAIVRPFK